MSHGKVTEKHHIKMSSKMLHEMPLKGNYYTDGLHTHNITIMEII